MLARIKTWALWLAGALIAIGSAWLWGRHGGKLAQRQATAARDAQAAAQTAQNTIKAHEVRHAVEAEVQKLPDAPPQAVGDADPASAAGRLRDDGWTRD